MLVGRHTSVCLVVLRQACQRCQRVQVRQVEAFTLRFRLALSRSFWWSAGHLPLPLIPADAARRITSCSRDAAEHGHGTGGWCQLPRSSGCGNGHLPEYWPKLEVYLGGAFLTSLHPPYHGASYLARSPAPSRPEGAWTGCDRPPPCGLSPPLSPSASSRSESNCSTRGRQGG